MRPFLLYHWSPVSRRKSILRHGLRPNHRSRDGSWKPPYLCWCRYPGTAWSLSAVHTERAARWDLWCVWSDRVGPWITRNCNEGRNARKFWWYTEYRSFQRVPKSKLWHVGTRKFVPRAKRVP